MDSNLQPAEKRPTHRQIMLAVIITAVTAIVAALAHTAVLLFSYDSSLGVYIYNGYSPVMFTAGTVIGLAAVIIAAVSVPSGACGIERVPVCGTAEAFFAAMAGAAYDTINRHLINTKTTPQDYDAIYTGDLGQVGTDLLIELFRRDGVQIENIHKDCGLMLYDREKQDVHAGGSGCGCSASVLCSYIVNSMRKNKFKKLRKNFNSCAIYVMMSNIIMIIRR